MRRRDFLRWAAGGVAGGLIRPRWVSASETIHQDRHLVILHTNDTHSRMDPFPMDGGPLEGLGGVARRSTLVRRVRSEHPNVLLLDSGDIFQGTPYFNFFKGEVEFKAMSALQYDVATLGNHDFDNGVEGLAAMMPFATFDFVSANYDVSGSLLESRVRPWVVRDVGGVKVGIFGLGVSFEGLVLESLHTPVRHLDPFDAARTTVKELRGEGCSLVVCLSHLGYRYGGDRPSDTLLAQQVPGIDLILGGHSHTFMDEPDVHHHPDGSWTLVNQVGWGGVRLGRIDVLMGQTDRPGADSRRPHEAPRWGWASYRIDGRLDEPGLYRSRGVGVPVNLSGDPPL